MKTRSGALLLCLLAGGCCGLEAGASGAAEVLGEPVPSTDPAEVRATILTRLLDRYATERGIRAEPAEIDALLRNMRRDEVAGGPDPQDDLTPKEQAEVDAMQRDMARDVIRQWKLNEALYEQYGGRIIRQQLGPEPLDAYRQFLRRRQADGAFAVRDEAMEKAFWRYFTDDSIHDFMAPGSADEAQAFKIAPWEQGP
jgi:hypothetical protein